VVVAVEVVFGKKIRNAVPRRIIEQQAAQYGLLCFDGMGWNTEGIQLRIGAGIHGANYTFSPHGKGFWQLEYSACKNGNPPLKMHSLPQH
jgi:hypothetical protein